MSVVLAGPYNSRSYIVGRHVLIKARKRCQTFNYRLIPMELKRWKSWLRKTCREHKWYFEEVKKYKVLSWLEQGYTGEPSVLLGDLPPLLEYLNERHGVSRTLTAAKVDELIDEIEKQWRKKEEEENKTRGLVISIVGAGSNEAVNLLVYALMMVKAPALKTGIKVRLFEARDDRENQLLENYNKMSLVETDINIILIEELGNIFENCDLIIFLGDKFRKPDMDIEEFFYLEKVLYSTYGFLCNLYMEEQTKVMFGCMENACFNAQCFLTEAPDIDKKRVVACTSYLGTELKSYISKIGRFPVDRIEDIPVWGMADTAHLVDADLGCFMFKVPDGKSDIIELNTKTVEGLVHEERVKLELYKRWELMENARVANWRYAKLKEKLQEDEYMNKILEEGINTVEIRNERIYMLNMMIEQKKEAHKISRDFPYWEPWENLMASVRGKDLTYTYENMLQRFKKSFYNVLQHYKYIEKEAMKKKMKYEKTDYKKLWEHAETPRDYFDPMNTGTIDLNAVQKILLEELKKDDGKLDEMEEELLFEETELIEVVNEIKMLRRELYERRKILYEIVRLYLKREMEEEIRRLERKLRRKNEEEMDEEGLFEEPDQKRESSLDDKHRENIKWVDAWEGEHEEEPETTREQLNEMIQQYFKLKMKLEKKIREFQGVELSQASSDDVNILQKMDDYEVRNLSTVTRNMRHLWEFVGVCKFAARKKIGQDPYIAQVTEIIKVMKIWFLDPYMKDEIVFLGIASDSEEYPFLTDTVISQPAYCDEDMRWHPQNDFKFLWPLYIQEKIYDDPEAPVPILRRPKEGDPFTVTYAMVTALKCLMHFEIPLATVFKFSTESQEHGTQIEETQIKYFLASEQEDEQESEEDSSTGPRLFINIESDFCPRSLTEMLSSETNINQNFRLQVFKKGIHDKHDVPVGFPLDTKGKSALDLKKELDKMDFGKVLYRTADPEGSLNESFYMSVEYIDDAEAEGNVRESKDVLQLHMTETLRVRSTLQKLAGLRESIHEEEESLILKVPPTPEDDRVDDDDEELFEPYYMSLKSGTLSNETTQSEEIKFETDSYSEEVARKPKAQSKEKLLKRISKFLKHPYLRPTSAIPDCYMDRSQKIVVIKRKEINFECVWLRNMIRRFGIPEKSPKIKESCVLFSANQNKRYLVKLSKTDLCKQEREWYGEEGFEEEMSLDIWKEGSDKTLESLRGSKDFDWEESRLALTSAGDVEKHKRFGSWIITIINEFKSFEKYLLDPNLPIVFEEGKEPSVKKLRIPEESLKNYRAWITKMIQTIIMIDKMRMVKKYMKESDSSLENTRTEDSREIVTMADMEIEHEWQEDMEGAEFQEEQVRNEDDESNDNDNDDVD